MKNKGFSLIELLVAATIFSFVVVGVSGLFAQALDLQRRAVGLQKIEENSQYVIESIAREVRVSRVTSGDTDCSSPGPGSAELTIEHPVNGVVTYSYDRSSGVGAILRNGQPITTSDVDFKSFAFCVSGSGPDNQQTRVTIPMTVEATSGRAAERVSISLQTTIASHDLTTDLAK